MKRLIFSFLVLIYIASGCAKNSGPVDSNSIQPNNKLDTLIAMSASVSKSTIYNHYFTTDSVFGYNVKTSLSDSTLDLNLLINGTQTIHDSICTISLTINNFTGPGTYNVNPPFVTAAWYLNNQRHFSNFGSIVIISDTSYALIGTFYFLADSIFVSGGKFNVLMPN